MDENLLDKVSRSTSEIQIKKTYPSKWDKLSTLPQRFTKKFKQGEPFLKYPELKKQVKPTPIKRKFNHNHCGAQQWRYIRPCEKAQLEKEEVYVAHHSHNFPRMMYYERPG